MFHARARRFVDSTPVIEKFHVGTTAMKHFAGSAEFREPGQVFVPSDCEITATLYALASPREGKAWILIKTTSTNRFHGL
jgi:hypothetical protein